MNKSQSSNDVFPTAMHRCRRCWRCASNSFRSLKP
ncbi:hypothetical protein ACLK1S_10090 [Escherichia coli]